MWHHFLCSQPFVFDDVIFPWHIDIRIGTPREGGAALATNCQISISTRKKGSESGSEFALVPKRREWRYGDPLRNLHRCPREGGGAMVTNFEISIGTQERRV